MFKHVIIGVDGQQGGRDAIALARRLTGSDAELTFAYVYWDLEHPWRGSNLSFDQVEREQAATLLAEERNRAGLTAALRCIGAASVGRGLHRLAEESGAELLVVGSSRHGVLGRVMMADDTRASLNGAPCAVAVAPAGFALEPDAVREIGIGFDGSGESMHALAAARTLAAEHGAKLSAFTAVSIPAAAYMAGVALSSDPIDELVEAARDRLRALGGVEAHAAYGAPAEELAVYSASLDLLVLGSRDYGPVGRLLHGSTSGQLARSARCPLLVLTRAARAQYGTHADGDVAYVVPTAGG